VPKSILLHDHNIAKLDKEFLYYSVEIELAQLLKVIQEDKQEALNASTLQPY